mgnify:CR=1 FL=1
MHLIIENGHAAMEPFPVFNCTMNNILKYLVDLYKKGLFQAVFSNGMGQVLPVL